MRVVQLARIMERIHSGAMSADELAESIHLSPQRMRQVLNEMVAAGFCVQDFESRSVPGRRKFTYRVAPKYRGRMELSSDGVQQHGTQPPRN